MQIQNQKVQRDQDVQLKAQSGRQCGFCVQAIWKRLLKAGIKPLFALKIRSDTNCACHFFKDHLYFRSLGFITFR